MGSKTCSISDRLANRLRIRGIVLPTLDIGLHVSWRHQLYGLSVRAPNKNKVFRSMMPIEPKDVIRGQYIGYFAAAPSAYFGRLSSSSKWQLRAIPRRKPRQR